MKTKVKAHKRTLPKKGTHKPKGKAKPVKQPKKHELKDNKPRIERPLGLTSIMKRYNTEEDKRTREKILDKAQQHILSIYMQQGMVLNGETINLDQLALYLRLDKRKIIERISIQADSLMGKEDSGQLGRALISMAILNSLADRGLIHQQALNLKQAQGEAYVPFLTSAYNDSLKNLLASNKPLIEIIKALNPTTPQGTSINIHNQNQQANSVPAGKAIGANEAVQLIAAEREGQTLLDSDVDKLKLLNQYVTGHDLPEVIATKQQGTFQEVSNLYVPTKKKKVHIDRNEQDAEITS